MLVRVVAPQFVAGCVFRLKIDQSGAKWICTHAAPVVRWALDKTLDQVMKHLASKGWKYQIRK
jgi:transposase